MINENNLFHHSYNKLGTVLLCFFEPFDIIRAPTFYRFRLFFVFQPDYSYEDEVSRNGVSQKVQSSNWNDESFFIDSLQSSSSFVSMQRYRYPPEMRAKIALYAIEYGVMPAVRKFSADTGSPIPRTTVQNMRNAYLKHMHESKP